MAFQLSWVNLSRNLILAYQSFGVVYGDLSISPLYVYTSTFTGKLQNHQNEEAIFGAFSLIFWTFTLMPLIKYVFIILSASDNNEGKITQINWIFPSFEGWFHTLKSLLIHFVSCQVAHLLSTHCFAGMGSLVYFPINRQLMRSSQPTNMVRQHSLHAPLC